MAAAAFLAPLALLASFLLSVYVRWLPVTATWAFARLTVLALATPTLRAWLGTRGPLIGAIAALGLAPIDWALAANAFSHPIVELSGASRPQETDAWLLLPFVVAGWSAASVLAGAVVARFSGGARAERGLRGLALAATCAGVSVLGYGAVRARLPEPARWLETRPIVATIPPDAWTDSEETGGSMSETAGTNDHVALLGVTLFRHCNERICKLGWKEHSAKTGSFGRSAAFVVRLDASSSILLVAATNEPMTVWPIRAPVPRDLRDAARALLAPELAWAYDEHEVRERDLTPRDVAPTLGPPRAWLGPAGLGLAIALVALLTLPAAHAKLGRGRDFARARRARVRDGEIEFDDGERWPAPRGFVGHEYDTVTVLPEDAGRPTTFRHAERPRFEVLVGTPGELEEAARATREATSAFALTSVVTLAAPLATALWILVGGH